MVQIRPAAVAGTFYPERAAALKEAVRALLIEAGEPAADAPAPKAVIAPHAGYVYSGAVAARAYARLRPLRGAVRRVVLIGPCHRLAVRGLAVPSAKAFACPAGTLPIDTAAIEDLSGMACVRVSDAAHAEEHCLEVHLPFLHAVLGEVSIVPILVGDAAPADVAAVLERLWDGPQTRIVVSSDLSHYLAYDAARDLDEKTCRAIEALDGDAIAYEQACGRTPIRGMLAASRRRGLTVQTLDLRNSGDTAGDRRRVVGYGAWALVEAAPRSRRAREALAAPGAQAAADADGQAESAAARGPDLVQILAAHGQTLLHLAAASIDNGLRHGVPMRVDPGEFAPALQHPGASFVTLRIEGQLRGCIGSAEAHRPLAHDVASNAFAAAFRDTRFARLKPDEWPRVALSLSVLSAPVPLPCTGDDDLAARLIPGRDGLIIESGGRRAVFLPQVWQMLPEPERFLANLKAKAGMEPGHWADDFRAWRFTSRSICLDAGDRTAASPG
jgi:AmmeMemoRadiSam system protein B/AmmeMemoRadiSam system protein A